jgi:uncharacterized membrane protein
MVTDEEVEAAARAIVETWAAEKMPGLTWAEAVQAEKEPDEFPALCTLAPLARKEARAALLAAEAARKPDVVPGLERARDLVRAVVGNDHTDDISWKVGFAMGKVTAARAIVAELAKHRPSPSPEHPVDDDALVRRLDGLPQP